MIARMWRGRAAPGKADQYRHHFETNVAPHLKDLAGHKGAYLLRREDDGEVEFLAVTLWESIDNVRAFAGDKTDIAVVEPEARAVLLGFDEFVQHYEVAYRRA